MKSIEEKFASFTNLQKFFFSPILVTVSVLEIQSFENNSSIIVQRSKAALDDPLLIENKIV